MKEIFCSFCGKSERDLDTILSGRTGNICNLCVHQAAQVLSKDGLHRQHKKHSRAVLDWQSLSPEVIKKHLDEYVVGQHHVKEILAVGVRNHYKRIDQKKQTMA